MQPLRIVTIIVLLSLTARLNAQQFTEWKATEDQEGIFYRWHSYRGNASCYIEFRDRERKESTHINFKYRVIDKGGSVFANVGETTIGTYRDGNALLDGTCTEVVSITVTRLERR